MKEWGELYHNKILISKQMEGGHGENTDIWVSTTGKGWVVSGLNLKIYLYKSKALLAD